MSATGLRGFLGLAAYRAISARGNAGLKPPAAERPVGELLWIHSAEPMTGRATMDLGRRMVRARYGLSVLLTFPDAARVLSAAEGSDDEVIVDHVPSEHPKAIASFLDHWAPDVCIWIWGGLRPNLIMDCKDRGIPLFLVNAGKDGFDRRRDRWLPEVPRRVLECFDSWLCRSEAAQLRLAQLGCPLDRIETVPPLQPVGQTLPVNSEDVEDVRDALKGRPVWFARRAALSELPAILAAHRIALKTAHRLLLVLEPEVPSDVPAISSMLEAERLVAAVWGDGEYPTEASNVLLADLPGEAGLWFSVAPVSFLGQSLTMGGRGADPYEAAAHGSAVLYGPNVGQYLNSYARLAAAGGARIVYDGSSLGNAVSRLVAPDRAATMAVAAWKVITEGASATDRVIELVNTALDSDEGGPE